MIDYNLLMLAQFRLNPHSYLSMPLSDMKQGYSKIRIWGHIKTINKGIAFDLFSLY